MHKIVTYFMGPLDGFRGLELLKHVNDGEFICIQFPCINQPGNHVYLAAEPMSHNQVYYHLYYEGIKSDEWIVEQQMKWLLGGILDG